MTSKIISQAAGLQFYFAAHSRENKYESRYSVKEGSSGYKEWQQGYQDTQNELWTRRISMKAKIAMFRGNQIVEETILLEEIWKNSTRE